MGPSPNQRGYSRKHVFEAVDGSLRRHGVEYIDLYQTCIWDPATDIEEMVHALADLVRAGKVLYAGATEMLAWQFVKAVYLAKRAGLPGFVAHQYHCNLIWCEAERELMPFCRDEGTGLLPYSPNARGFLSGRRRRAGPAQTERAALDAVEAIASERGVSPSQIATAWVLAQPGPGTLKLDASELARIDATYLPRRNRPHA